MAILNFPNDPKIGETYDENGVRYTWEGVQWTARNSGDYVEKSGDNMTGDLTLGIDKITLNADDGQIQAGYITCDGSLHNGAVTVRRDNTLGSVFTGELAEVGEANEVTSVIYASGDASFNGSITADGSATFGSTITLNPPSIGSDQVNITWSPTGGVIYLRDDSGDINVTLSGADGSATFAGQITSGVATGSPNTSGASLGPAGYCSVSHKDRQNQNCFTIIDTTLGSSTFSVNGNGSAEFAGPVEVGNRVFGSDTNYGARIQLADGGGQQYGGFYAQSNGANSTAPSNLTLFEGRDGSDITFEVKASGAATCAGNIKSGILNINSSTTTGVNCYNSGEIYQQCLGNSSDSLEVYRIYKGTTRVYSIRANGAAAFSNTVSASNLLVNLEPENLSNYRTTSKTYEVDGEKQTEEIQDYIGPVLDVKDTLVRYETTLKSVKQAVEEAQDFPTLKEALLKALTKI